MARDLFMVRSLKSKSLAGSAILLLALASAACKKSDDGDGTPYNGGDRRIPYRYGSENYNDKVNRFDGNTASGDTLRPDTISSSSTSTSYTREDRVAMGKSEIARVILPAETACMSNQGQWSIVSGGSNIRFTEENLTQCTAKVEVLSTASADSEKKFGVIKFTGNVRHNGAVKAASYTVRIYDKNLLTAADLDAIGGTPGSNTGNPSDLVEQEFISIGDQLNIGSAAGHINMFQYDDQQSGQKINTLIFPTNVINPLITSITVDLKELTDGYTYAADDAVVKCWIAHSDVAGGPITAAPRDLPLHSHHGVPTPANYYEGDPVCPIKHNSLNRAEQETGIQLITEELPNFPDRLTLYSLGRYAGFKEGAKNYVGYEIRLKATKSGSPDKYVVSTYFFVINVHNMQRPNELSSYEYIGKHNGHAYFLFRANTGYAQIFNQAALLKEFIVAEDAYPVEVNTTAELEFLRSKVPGSRVWLGLDDRTQEGQWKSYGGGTPLLNWAGGEPNNDGNEDCAAMNFWGANGLFGDTECDKTYSFAVEVEMNPEDLAILR